MKYDEFILAIQTTEVFFLNSYEEIALRSTPGEKGKFFMKGRGKVEVEAPEGSEIVADGILEHNVITEKQYQNY